MAGKGMTVDLSVHDRYMLGRRLAQSPQVIANKLNKTMLNVAIDFERTEKQTVPVITGRLQNSIWTERDDLRYTIQPNTVYAGVVDKRRDYVATTFAIVEPRAQQEIKATVQEIIKSI